MMAMSTRDAMGAYVRSDDGRAKIAKALAELDAGKGIPADKAYFKELKRRTHAAALQAPRTP